MHSQMPSMTRSHMSGRQWGKPLLRWTAFPAPSPDPALPQPGLVMTLTLKPCLPQSVQSPTAALCQGTALHQRGQAQGGFPLGMPMLMRASPVLGQTWGHLLNLSRALGAPLMRTPLGAVRHSPCKTVCGPGRARIEDGHLVLLLA